MNYETVIGLEVHAELSTKTKIYCGCKNEFGAEANTHCCPICTGMPGTLPTLNKQVVEYAVKMGCALGCTVNKVSKQDRKNYFYPDLPKAYQISQFDVPLCENGHVDILVDGKEKRIGVTRIHIEEDAGKLLHDGSVSGTLIDFNRCGVPLIEIVSEPDMRSPQEAKAYLETVRSILQYLDISDCKMQEGSIRCDVNVSVMEEGSGTFGTRCEMKNVNSFRAAVRAIEYEAKRQIAILEAGGVIQQETRKWDDVKGESIPLRSKEDAEDYRFFPEPDLAAIVLTDEYLADIRKTIPELPNAKIARYIHDYGLSAVDAALLAEDMQKVRLFEETLAQNTCTAKSICNWILGDILKCMNAQNVTLEELGIKAVDLAALIALIEQGTISNAIGKKVFELMLSTKKDPKTVVKENNFTQISDENVLLDIVKTVLASNQKSVDDYLSGKKNALGFLVGQCMSISNGQGNPAKLKELLLGFLKE